MVADQSEVRQALMRLFDDLPQCLRDSLNEHCSPKRAYLECAHRLTTKDLGKFKAYWVGDIYRLVLVNQMTMAQAEEDCKRIRHL